MAKISRGLAPKVSVEALLRQADDVKPVLVFNTDLQMSSE